MILLDIAIAGCGFAFLVSAYRIARGPTPADRAIAADLLTFAVIGLIALIGVRAHRHGTFDLVLVATLVAFLAAVSLARAIANGRR
ncbi:monovalent cation/H+ antiporter complex subunit F [Micromonospora sp. NPDC047793]|jgi:multicomponent Na+:H+ antiporter subunit F|uniref:monovalent cation/H+ antiporter complex subunit F n=1 Tax=unclassified Micromonospora TaxID=2617518 RepID=UPI00103486F0|nr:monovalent cation/H+ antiporter complex subunit F [Verrucosispora sp. SN26_14.1]TBL37535.1 pesticidal protein Cry26Aa [Verrucosispora sp. SN26_14.1]